MRKVKDVEALKTKAVVEYVRSIWADEGSEPFREIVGVIFHMREDFVSAVGKEALTFEMENTGEPGTFKVEPSEFMAVSEEMIGEYGVEVFDAIVNVDLWHSHKNTKHASETDILQFPNMLASRGIVYHAPTGESSAYTRDGIISGQYESIPSVTSLPIDSEDSGA